MTPRPALFAALALLALPAAATAGERVTLQNDGLTSSVQMELVSAHCVDGMDEVHNYTLAPTDSLKITPAQSQSGPCSWDVATQESAWHVAVYATTPGRAGGKQLLGFVQGNGTNDAAWMPTADDDTFVVVTVRDVVGSLNLFVQQARLSPLDRTMMDALATR